MVSTTENPNTRPTVLSVFQAPEKRRLIFCLLLALATISLYNPVTRAPFLNFDDDGYVTENMHVRSGLTWNTTVWAFHTTEQANWHPITWLSHALDCQLFGLNPAGPHTVNILLHAANVVLLFLILQSATGLDWFSLMVALLFALHPLNVESVAWIAERKNVLSMFFFLSALAAYGWYARKPGIGRYFAVTAAYAMGLMTKPQVITFPFALLLLDYWPLYRLASTRDAHAEAATRSIPVRSFGSLVWEKVPWLALSALSAVITMKTQAAAAWAGIPLWVRLGNSSIAYGKYLAKAFWPLNLAPVYPYPQHSISVVAILLCTAMIVAVSILAAIFHRRRPYFVGWFWFLGTAVPMIGLVQVGVQSMADRYAYIPLLGIFVVICWGAADLIRNWHVPTYAAAAVTVIVLLGMAIALHRQVSFWSDNLTLWNHTLEVTGPNYTAEDNVASELLVEGREQEALPHLLRARLLRPDDPAVTLNIANYERLHGHYEAALEGFAKVLQLTTFPSFLLAARLDSGYTHFALKQYDNAKQDFEAALVTQPGNAEAYCSLGLLAQKNGEMVAATQNYEQSVALDPSPVGYLLLAQAFEIRGETSAAQADRSRAARSSRNIDRDIATMKQLLAQ